jgi:hypothetical protein
MPLNRVLTIKVVLIAAGLFELAANSLYVGIYLDNPGVRLRLTTGFAILQATAICLTSAFLYVGYRLSRK